MDTDEEILGNTVQCLISVSDHHCPTYFQAFSRCYRKKKKISRSNFCKNHRKILQMFLASSLQEGEVDGGKYRSIWTKIFKRDQ